MSGFRFASALVAICAFGAFAFQLYETLGRHPNRDLVYEFWRQARYFTYLTTLLIGASAAWAAWRGTVSPSLAAGLALWSLAIGGVYHTLLARDLAGLRWWTDHGLHTLVPLAVGLWWLMFAPKDGLVKRDAMRWLIWPAAYVTFVLIRGEIDGRHPYFFIDPPLIGWPMVSVWCALLLAVFWLAGLGMVALGRRLSSMPGRPESAGPDGPQPL